MTRLILLLLAAAGLAVSTGGFGAIGDATPQAAGDTTKARPVTGKKKAMRMKKPMKMEEPMTSPMSQPGMMKKDVPAERQKKEAEMQDMLEQEQREMK